MLDLTNINPFFEREFMKNALLLLLATTTAISLTSCGDRSSSIYDNNTPTINSMGISGNRTAELLSQAPFVCDKFSRDGCIDEVLLMAKAAGSNLQTCVAFFIGENTIATATKCLPNKSNFDYSCANIAFKDLKSNIYTCSSITSDNYSEIALIHTKKKSEVGFLEVSTEGVKFGDFNKTFEVTSFTRSNVTNFAISEGRYTRAKKKCIGVQDSLISTINDSKDSKNFILSGCAVDWNSTGAPVIVNGKVAALLHGKIEGASDFGATISEKDGVAIAENFACQTTLNEEVPADCALYSTEHKKAKFFQRLSDALEGNTEEVISAVEEIKIFKSEESPAPVLVHLPAASEESCSSKGDTNTVEACVINLQMKNKYLSIVDFENVELDCDNKVTVESKVVNSKDGLIEVKSFDSYSLDGIETYTQIQKVTACE